MIDVIFGSEGAMSKPKTCWKCRGKAQGRVRYRWQVFATGDAHLREDCGRCGRFIRYAPQTPEAVKLAGPKPEGPRDPDVPRLPPETRAEAAAFRKAHEPRTAPPAALTCLHCGRVRPAGEFHCPGCASPWVVRKGGQVPA